MTERPVHPGLREGMTDHEWQQTRPDRQRWCGECRRMWRPNWNGESFWPTWCPYCALVDEHGRTDSVEAVLMVNPPLGAE